MYSFQKVNNVDFEGKYRFVDFFLNKNYGTSVFFLKKMELRFEHPRKLTFDELEHSQVITLLGFLFKIFPKNLFFSNYVLLNIIFLDFSYSYRGWRHLVGLPSNGQRTWSNARTAYSSNKDLRDYKYKLGKLFFGRLASGDVNLILMSEYINTLWRKQWFSEWTHSRNILKRSTKKKGGVFKFDLNATARGWLGNLKKNNPKLGKKKKKTLTGTVGFDPGFMKTYLNFRDLLKKKSQKTKKKNKRS